MTTPAPWGAGSFLAGLPEPARAALLRLGVVRRFEAGRRLLREGEESTHVLALIGGFVKITAIADGVETLLAIRVPGDVVGETSPLTNRPRMATVTACGPVASRVIQFADFRRFLDQFPAAGVGMATAMSSRLRFSNERRSDMTAYRTEVRLARVLAELAVSCGRPTGDGTVIDVALTHSELASMVGIGEATAQKAIRELRLAGLIRTGYRSITIINIDGLTRLADRG